MAPTAIIPRNNQLRRTRRVSRGRFRTPARVPRVIGLRYNGEYKLNRTLSFGLTVGGAGVGWAVGGANYQSVSIVFDPTGLNIFGSAVNFINVPMTNAAEISSLWERIRIDKVELTFAPRYEKADGIASGFNANPQLLLCNDVNSGSAGTTLAEILQRPDAKHFTTNESFKWTCYPKHQRLVYYTPLTSSYEPATGFVNSDTAIPHYSVHMSILDLGSASANMAMHVTAKYFMTLRNVK